MRAARAIVAVLAAMIIDGPGIYGQSLVSVPPAPPDCGSVVIVKCDRPDVVPPERARQEAARRIESRRVDRATVELDRVIIEDDAERGDSPEKAISRALSRPSLRPGEQTFAAGEGAQCTCRNVCPPPPLPCCVCTDRPGSRQATGPGWKPTN
jgi:hypothetical protein